MNNIFLQGIWEPCASEYDMNDMVVIGKIPQELNGTFYRNGPNPQYVYSDKYHMFEGDGMIHAMTFCHGQVSYKNRWIRTEKFLAEQKAQKSLFGGMRDQMACDESARNISRNTGNTNVIWHHNKLLALNEGALPVEMDRQLATLGNYYFQQQLDRSMMAHPKIDPQSGELFFYSYFGPDFMYFIANKHGQLIHKQKIKLPFLSLMHDFAITQHFTILPLFPLTWDMQRKQNNESFFKWEPQLNTRFAIMPRYGSNAEIVWFEDESCLAMHTVNAYEQRDNIVLEMVVMDTIPQTAVAFTDDNITYPNYFIRWIFNLKSKKVIKQRLDTLDVEFPRVDERFVGLPYQHAYMAGTLNPQWPTAFFDAIIHYDIVTNQRYIHHFGNDAIVLEPIFVPRSADSAEGDGFLLAYVYRKKENRSDLVILDAKHIESEPLALVQLPHRVPFGFHGCWVQ